MSTLKLQIPNKILVKDVTPHTGTFIIKPLEQGFGHAIGNALRRVLLSSTEGYAITHLKLPEGSKHVFDRIPGVSQDINIIILNLKKVAFKAKDEKGEPTIYHLKVDVKNKKSLLAADLVKGCAGLAVCNADLEICKMDEKASFVLDLIVQKGRGYTLAIPENLNLEKREGYENIDALFSPIKNVNYVVKDARVEGKTDYEALEITVTTNEAITPQRAIEESAYYLIQHFNKIVQQEIVSEELRPREIKLDKNTLKLQRNLRTPLRDIGFSPRAFNGFKSNGIRCMADIVKLSLQDLSNFRNFGSKTIEEVKQKLEEYNVEFGMDLSPYRLEEDKKTRYSVFSDLD